MIWTINKLVIVGLCSTCQKSETAARISPNLGAPKPCSNLFSYGLELNEIDLLLLAEQIAVALFIRIYMLGFN